MKTTSAISCILGLVVFLFYLSPLQSFNQIIYIDIDPDTTISENGGYYDIDVMGDDSAEFRIKNNFDLQHGMVQIQILHDSCYVSGLHSDCAFAVEYQLNDSLGANNWWVSYYINYILALDGATVCLHSGMFIGDTNGYLGLRWFDTGITYYGWIRVDVADDATWFTVKDFAYAPFPILAGQSTSTSINEIKPQHQFIVFENENLITVRNKEHSRILEARLFVLLSREYFIAINNDEIILNKDQLIPGLYLLYLSAGKDQGVLKILVR